MPYPFGIKLVLTAENSLGALFHIFIRDTHAINANVAYPRLLKKAGHATAKAATENVLLDGDYALNPAGYVYDEFHIKWLGKTSVNYRSLNSV